MSIDATTNSATASSSEPKLSKEERRQRKEEKRAKKAAKAGVSGAGGGESVATSAGPSTAVASPVPAEPKREESKEEKRKRKEEKKRKRALDGEQAGASTAESTSASTPVPDVATEQPQKKSKKDKKEKTDKPINVDSSNSISGSTAQISSSSGSSKPSIPTTFTPAHTAYLTAQGITLSPSLYPPILDIPSLPISPAILNFLSRFPKPTPIQACAWPPLLAGRDVVGVAETGSGKTLGFGVPGLQFLSGLSPRGEDSAAAGGKKNKKAKKNGGAVIQLLVLAPTRELALQSHETLNDLGKALGIESVCLYGGVGKDAQLASLAKEKTRIVVGTPGRVLDLADSGDMDLSTVQYLVLDEADRMLDQGFENDIRRIIGHTEAKGRQTVMFSATWPESVRRLASTFLNNPIRITVGSDELSANKRIEQIVEVLDSSREKDARMLYHLRTHLSDHPSSPSSPTRILVFALYKKEAERLQSTIGRNRYKVAGLHGDMGQNERFKALDQFKRGEVNVLVATDVAARGLDIPDVQLVINVTFPLTTEDFVHRCGRTGRAGKSGKAVTFFTGENHEKSLAGEFMRVLRDVGADIPKEMDRFPSTIKKKEHGSYGAFYKDTADAPAATKITFD